MFECSLDKQESDITDVYQTPEFVTCLSYKYSYAQIGQNCKDF